MTLDYCPVLEDLYTSRVAVGRSGKPFALTSGLSTINNLRVIRTIMMTEGPGSTLEIGMACGGSTLTIAASHRDLGRAADSQHTAIDGFQTQSFDDVGRVGLEKAGLDGYVDVVEELSSLALPGLMASSRTFDMIYVDGSHEFDDVFCDAYYARKLLNTGGLILFDDSSCKGVSAVLKSLFEHDPKFRHVSTNGFRGGRVVDRVTYRLAELAYRTQLRIYRKLG